MQDQESKLIGQESIIELENVPRYIDVLGRTAMLLHQLPASCAEEARELATELHGLDDLLRTASKSPMKLLENAENLRCYLSIGEK